ncbi:MAG: hypothetical protein ACRC1M_06025 [Methanobacteriaceae archaeon]
MRSMDEIDNDIAKAKREGNNTWLRELEQEKHNKIAKMSLFF